ncbi:hypothetical protein ACLB2K_063398 [Fragaria x ananassa]
MSLHDESQGLSLGEEENAEGGSLPSKSHAGGVTINKKRKTSACWRSFEELPRGPDLVQRAKCKKWGVVLECGLSLGTCSLLRHQSKCSSSDTTVVSPQSATRSDMFRHARFVELVIEAIVRHDLLFAFVEYEGIRAMFSYICCSLGLPCRNIVKARVLDMFENEKDFDVHYRSGPSSSLRSELSKYLDEARLDRSMESDILAWWKMEQHRYPIFFHMARDVLTIPISTIAYESAFSIGGRVLDQYQSSLLSDIVQVLLCTHDWIFGKKEKKSPSVNDLTEYIFHMTLFDHHDALEEQESFS